MCLLHTNELPLRHVFSKLDGKTKAPDLYPSSIEKQLYGDVPAWCVVEFDKVLNPNFPVLAQEPIDNLSSDQYYANKISIRVILRNIQEACDLKVGFLCDARWLTLACCILKFCASQKHPPNNLVIFAKFCIYVYFITWFQIKEHHFIADGAKKVF